MRDNHEDMPEIVDVFELTGSYFGIVAVAVNGLTKKFQFGLSHDSYRVLKKIFQLRPFDMMPGLPHRYFFSGASRKNPGSLGCSMWIRIEQGLNAKSMTVDVPQDLAANLEWFFKLKDFKHAEHLMEIVTRPGEQ